MSDEERVTVRLTGEELQIFNLWRDYRGTSKTRTIEELMRLAVLGAEDFGVAEDTVKHIRGEIAAKVKPKTGSNIFGNLQAAKKPPF